jgi:anthranilate phosphoribosyltransferase
MDEISTLGRTVVYDLKESSFDFFHLFPNELGLRTPSLNQLEGSDSEQNAKDLVAIISGVERGPKRDLALINAAGALVVVDLAPGIDEGMRLAAELVDSGQASAKLRDFQQAFGVSESQLA